MVAYWEDVSSIAVGTHLEYWELSRHIEHAIRMRILYPTNVVVEDYLIQNLREMVRHVLNDVYRPKCAIDDAAIIERCVNFALKVVKPLQKYRYKNPSDYLRSSISRYLVSYGIKI